MYSIYGHTIIFPSHPTHNLVSVSPNFFLILGTFLPLAAVFLHISIPTRPHVISIQSLMLGELQFMSSLGEYASVKYVDIRSLAIIFFRLTFLSLKDCVIWSNPISPVYIIV